jgi:hypothetical protein
MKNSILFIAIFILASYNAKVQSQPVSLCGNYAINGNFQIGKPDSNITGYGKKLFFGAHTENGDSFTDNQDPVYMYRYNVTTTGNSQSELRVNIGDDDNDKFVVGRRHYNASATDFTPMFTIVTNGKVGINNYNPSQALDVNGNVKVNGNQYILSDKALVLGNETDQTKRLRFQFIGASSGGLGDAYIDYGGNLYFRGSGSEGSNPIVGIDKNGNVSIGGIAGATLKKTLTVYGNIIAKEGDISIDNNFYLPINKKLVLGDKNDLNRNLRLEFISGNTSGDSYISTGGSLYVRTNALSNPIAAFRSSGLEVKGTVKAKSLITSTIGWWPDFVFSKDYRLPTLNEVKRHIQENKHLPGIPTETEVKENGIEVGEIQAKLLQKIEELTLYMIQQQETIDELKSEMILLKNRKE